MTIEVRHQVPTTVETDYVQLPYYFKSKYYYSTYYMIKEDLSVTQAFESETYAHASIRVYKTPEEVGLFLESLYSKEGTDTITPEEFNEALTKVMNKITQSND